MANVSSFSGAMPVIPGGTVELGYKEITSSVSPSTTGYPAATDVIPAMTVVCDGGPVLVEFWCCYAKPANTADQSLTLTLFVDGSENQRYWGYLQTPASANSYKPVHLMCRLSPSAGSHTFAVKATVSSGTGTIGAGAGGGAVESPAFLRVSKIVNQNDGLKPFWTPPVVTQLPSQATVGDQVIYAADATNGVYWHLQYDGLGTYPWKFIGGAQIHATGTGGFSSSSTPQTSNTPSLTLPLSGDYMTIFGGAVFVQANSISDSNLSLFVNGVSQSSCRITAGTTFVGSNIAKNVRITGVTAGHVANVRYFSSQSVNTSYGELFVSCTPIRVSA